MRLRLGFGLVLALLLLLTPATLAVPVSGAKDGQLMVMGDADWSSFNIGVGYGVNDNLTMGAAYNVTDKEFAAYGLFGQKAFAAQVETWFTDKGPKVILTGLWQIKADPVRLGLGGGADIHAGSFNAFLTAAIDLVVEESLHLYGAVRYFPNKNAYPDTYVFKAGLSYGF
jgi:hypothetical protein